MAHIIQPPLHQPMRLATAQLALPKRLLLIAPRQLLLRKTLIMQKILLLTLPLERWQPLMLMVYKLIPLLAAAAQAQVAAISKLAILA